MRNKKTPAPTKRNSLRSTTKRHSLTSWWPSAEPNKVPQKSKTAQMVDTIKLLRDRGMDVVMTVAEVDVEPEGNRPKTPVKILDARVNP